MAKIPGSELLESVGHGKRVTIAMLVIAGVGLLWEIGRSVWPAKPQRPVAALICTPTGQRVPGRIKGPTGEEVVSNQVGEVQVPCDWLGSSVIVSAADDETWAICPLPLHPSGPIVFVVGRREIPAPPTPPT